MKENFDITIIGGSFIGMTCALALSNISNDLKIAIIEQQDIINDNRKSDGRAYAVSSNSLELFKEIGILENLQQNSGTISAIKITDHKSPFLLDFLGQEENSAFGLVIESFHIHNALRDKIKTQQNITIFCPNIYEQIDFTENSVLTQLDNESKIESKLLLACDGRFSKLREIYKIPTTTKNYQQNAIVVNISHERAHENIAHEKFLPNGPLAILPLENQHKSSIVWVDSTQTIQTILELDEENFLQQLNKRMENCLGKIELISKKFSYPLILVEAEKFYHERMLFVGDAACGVHPIAGQGFNLGVVGIKILQQLVKEKLFTGLDLEGVVAEYNRKAKFEAKKMVIATDLLNSIFECKSYSFQGLRDIGLGLVNKIPRLKNFFIKSAGGKK